MYSSTKLNSIHSDILFCPIPDTVNEKKTLLSEVITRAKDAFRLKSYQDADLLYSRAITITPDDTYYANRSLIRLKLNNIGEANRDANKVIELNPDWAKGYFRKAQILEKQEEYKDAIHYYKLSLARTLYKRFLITPSLTSFERVISFMRNILSFHLNFLGINLKLT